MILPPWAAKKHKKGKKNSLTFGRASLGRGMTVPYSFLVFNNWFNGSAWDVQRLGYFYKLLEFALLGQIQQSWSEFITGVKTQADNVKQG